MLRSAWNPSLLVCLLLVGCAQSEGTPPASGNAGNGVAGTTGGSGSSGAGGAGASAAGAGGSSTGVAGNGTAGSGVAGSGGAGAAGGAAGRGGAAGGAAGAAGGTAGRGGSAGGQSGSAGRGGAAGGVAGSGGGIACTITTTTMMSTQIPTVAVVTFTTTLTGVTGASIQFGLPGATPMVAPVDLAATNYRTLLLGMKGSRDYVYRIVVNSAAGSCTSQDVMLRTGTVPTSVPKPTRTIPMASAHAPGFIITSGGTGMGGSVPVYILDGDGEPVWWATAPASCSRAKMSWDGKEMWMQELNVDNAGGEMRKIAMDGTGAMNNVTGLSASHHDFTVTPEGGIVSMLWTGSGMDAPNSLVERSASGQVTTIVANLNTLYRGSGSGNSYHANAIQYYQSDDSFTISDRNVNVFVKVKRNGQLVWQLGGSTPIGQAFTVSGGTWTVNHGHHLLPNGNFLFFSNGSMMGGTSQALEYSLNTTSWTATRVWQYAASGVNSPVLSDAQRLPNGNTLVTFSTVGTIHEVSPSGQLVMSLKTNSVGYADYRESLYGPPLR